MISFEQDGHIMEQDVSKSCQSCGMPMKKDPNGGGTNADGSTNDTYCSLCYEHGAFLAPDFSVEEMQLFCIEQLKKKGLPKFVGWLLTRGLPELERWKV